MIDHLLIISHILYHNCIGYSNNQLGDADDDSINSGGQCADGLKMVVLIGEDLTTPDPITPGVLGLFFSYQLELSKVHTPCACYN